MNTTKYHFFLFAFLVFSCYSFDVYAFAGKSVLKKSKSTRLGIGSLQKTTNRQEYNKVVDGLMFTRGITREEAEKEYNAYLDNPNNYALQKGEAYYKSLGYKSLMDGVIGEAEKEGRGEEVRARVEKFRKDSNLKGLITIGSFIALGFYLKITHPYVPPSF
mmetsp:Transcript_16947/g.16990  ORF Transcript_16947/g.16990 Transcript_16947/m.16990 type:complete len:161 (-) Transcript_16947:1639-2121(-)